MKGNLKGNFKYRKKSLFLIICCCGALTACGTEEGGSIYNFAGAEPKEIDPWVYLQDTALSSSTQIRGFASSAGSLGITIGVMGIVFSIFYMVIRLLFQEVLKQEVK